MAVTYVTLKALPIKIIHVKTKATEDSTADKLLAYIIGHVEDNGYAPAVREIAARFNKSHTWVLLWLKELQKQKRLKVTEGVARGIKVIYKKK